MQAGLAASVLRCDPQPAGLDHHSPPRMCMLVSSKTQAALGRRSWLLRCLGALGLHVASTAQDQRSVSAFVKLKEPVLLPLDKVAEPWRPLGFIARCSVPARPQRPSAEVRLKGVLLRLPRPSGDATVLRSYCLTCPHEICQVDLTEETKAVWSTTDGYLSIPSLFVRVTSVHSILSQTARASPARPIEGCIGSGLKCAAHKLPCTRWNRRRSFRARD